MNPMDITLYILFWVNLVAVILVSISFIPQFLFFFFFFLKRRHWKESNDYHKVAVIIAAHNEEEVIRKTVKAVLQNQNYPKDKLKVYVCAHNCKDRTATEAEKAGAKVYVLNDPDPDHARVSYPLRYRRQQILKEDKDTEFFIRIDADNFLHPDFVRQRNNSISGGAKIVRAYEAASNLKQNIWTETCALFYTKDSRLQNTFRQAVHSTSRTPGPGLTFTREVAEKRNGWDSMGAAEDAEFCLNRLYDGYKCYFNTDAIVYEDQPSSFRDTFCRLIRLGHSLNKLFFTDGWKRIVRFFKTGNLRYLDRLIQIGFNPISVICFLWFPIYYIFYAIIRLIQGFGGIQLLDGYFSKVGISNYHHDNFFIRFYYWDNSTFNALAKTRQNQLLGQAAIYDLLIRAVEVIAVLLLLCILQSFVAVFLDRRKLGRDYRLKGRWKGILLSPIFTFVYGFSNVVGVISKLKWVIAKRNPNQFDIHYPLPERKKKIKYFSLSEREKRRYQGKRRS